MNEMLTDEEFAVLSAVLGRSDVLPVRNPLDLEPGERGVVQDLLLAEFSEKEVVDGDVTDRGQLIERIIDKFRPWNE